MATKRGPGRPRKIQNVEENVVTQELVEEKSVVQELLPVRTYMRTLSLLGIDDPEASPGRPPQFVSVQTVENDLKKFYDDGYKLLSAEYIGDVQEGTSIRILYILVLA